jgi:hypothetical protein
LPLLGVCRSSTLFVGLHPGPVRGAISHPAACNPAAQFQQLRPGQHSMGSSCCSRTHSISIKRQSAVRLQRSWTACAPNLAPQLTHLSLVADFI